MEKKAKGYNVFTISLILFKNAGKMNFLSVTLANLKTTFFLNGVMLLEQTRLFMAHHCDSFYMSQNISLSLHYRKVPKFSDARKLCCNQPKIQTKRPN